MTLTLITVNYNNARATIELLRSLERQQSKAFDVIVVDNDSRSDDRALLGSYATSSPLRLDIIYSDRNRGFSGGNNLAVRKALAQGAEWLVIINNDTVVPETFITSLASQLPAEPAIVAFPLQEGERTAYAGVLEWLYPTLPHRYHSVPKRAKSDLYAIGAGMAVHRDVFETIGLMDERYFLYFEDADYSARAARAGIPILFCDFPVITHGVSQSTSSLGSPLLLRYHMRNAILFNALHAPRWARAALPLWIGAVAGKQVVKILFGRSRPQSVAILSGIVDALEGRWGLIPTTRVIAVECESLEDASWGVARMVRGLLKELSSRDELVRQYRIDLYFKSRVPDEAWIRNPLFRTHVVRAPSWLPVPVSFSLYYYTLLPLRLWWDRPSVTYWPNYMLPIIAPKPSVVMLTEDIWHQIHNKRLALRYRVAYAVFSRFAARRATRIMAISDTSKQNVHRLFGVPLARIESNALAVDEPQRSVVPMPGPYVLFVGQAFERRHLRETIDAFVSIAPRHPDVRFIAIGPDKYEPPVIDRRVAAANATLRRPAVQHIDRVSDADLARFYAGARSIVYVSAVEAFGLPPLEALSYGVPAVLADTELNREIYAENAFYTITDDAAGIAVALERSLTDESARDRISERAQTVVARYTWKAHADRMLRIIDGILTPHQ
jgi:GT2 family glycosyltransferase/glycosyltransferase involved in cell wall biosynthesis